MDYPENKKSIKESNEMPKTDHMTILASYSLLDGKVGVRKARGEGVTGWSQGTNARSLISGPLYKHIGEKILAAKKY